jgi:UDP-N-acetylmuramoyl-tripeptide--D-alanyl-D-alanine ligase
VIALSELARQLPCTISGDLSCDYQSVTQDSRRVSPGSVYIAMPGARVDGHDYVVDAKIKGAVCAIVERQIAVDIPQIVVEDAYQFTVEWAKYARAQWQGKTVIALTGSLGKTTHKELLLALCSQQGPAYATPGNYNNLLGLSLTILNVPANAKTVILELGISEIDEMASLATLAQPDIAYVTNIHPCHLSGLKDETTIAKEKSKIYQSLTEDGLAYIKNLDDHVDQFVASSGHCQQQLLHAANFELNQSSIKLDHRAHATFTMKLDGKAHTVSLQMPGKHMVDNAYAAAVIAYRLGVSGDQIVSVLSNHRATSGRMQRYVHPQSQAHIIDDSYNANPRAMEAAIASLGAMQCARKILVCGDMAELGDSATYWHTKIGEWATQHGIDYLLATGTFADSAVMKFDGTKHIVHNHADLLSALQHQLAEGVVVMIKGSRSNHLDRCVQALVAEKTKKEQEVQ